MKPRLTGLQLMTDSRIIESLRSQMTSMLKFFMWEKKHGLDFKFCTVFGAWNLGSQRLMRAIHKLSLVSLNDYKRSNHSLISYIYKLFEHLIITLFKTSSGHTKPCFFSHMKWCKLIGPSLHCCYRINIVWMPSVKCQIMDQSLWRMTYIFPPECVIF